MEHHIGILLLIGIGIFLGLSGGEIFQKLKIPQVVGYIIIGVIVGDSFLGLFPLNLIDRLTPINSFALGLIGFMIGGELKADIFKKYGKQFIYILLWEGLATFILVTAVITFYTGKLYIGILLGALASATAPAATVDVLWEYKSKGILTTTVLAIVALDDGLALILYGFASVFAKTLITGESFSFLNSFVTPVKELSSALILGALTGYVLYRILLKIQDKEHLLVLSIGAILITTGLSAFFDLDLILSNMTMGIVLANQSPRMSKRIFEAVKSFTPPIYVLFFVLVGARLQIGLLLKIGVLGLLYIIARTIGKFSGSYIGAVLTNADSVVRKYLGLALFSQAGVAIGLSIAIYQTFGKFGPAGQELGLLILNVVAGTTFIVQVIGPPSVKLAIAKAGEIGKDIDEDDLLNKYKVEKVIKKDVETITTTTRISTVIDMLKNSDYSDFPLIDQNREYLGVISFKDIKDLLFNTELADYILAEDVNLEDVQPTYPSESLKSAMNKFMYETISFLPVLESENSRKFVGILLRSSAVNLVKHGLIDKTSKDYSSSTEYKIHKLLDKGNMKLELRAHNLSESIIELIDLLNNSGMVSDKEEIIKLLMERESQSPTAIGHGVALPHVRTDKVSHVVCALGRSNKRIDAVSPDDIPVRLVFLILTPKEQSNGMLKITSALSKLLLSDNQRDALLAAKTHKEILNLLKKWET